ncbi:SAM-dependent methyltransferase [Clostridium zeae]|uniref:SAM-dependent methyltransferase n=1 Tax=Clostridium zeae TaxID=2759022 RepID=A0ABQ1E9S1_9CLOT|nr:class I SAM-dependent methyltransferase [Clostridium zeae]GFZ31395.1 SAM-dependent methyltransferase [Clostridium zeae]
MRNFEKTESYYKNYGKFFEENKMLGPNAMWLIEILCEKMDLKPGMRVLDMGCGMGLTSIYLAKEFGVTVFANDLWINPTDNYHRFVEMKVEDKVFPIRAEAHSLPYAEGYFDAAISIDAYHYFGTDEIYLPNYYSKLVKKGGQFGIVSPGLTREFTNGLPEKMKDFWEPDMYCFHSASWWKELWSKTGIVDVTYADTIEDGKELWRTTADFDLHDADIENYLTLIAMTAIKK